MRGCDRKQFWDKEQPDRNDQLGKREELKMIPNDAHSLEGATSVMRTLQEEYVSICCKLVTSVAAGAQQGPG